MRLIISRALTIVAAIVVAAWLAGGIGTDKATAQQQDEPTRANNLKICKATNNAGRTINWGCQANQPCCFNAATNTGYCGPVGGSC